MARVQTTVSVFMLVLGATLPNRASGTPLIPMGSYPIDPIYQADVPGIGPLGVISPGSSLCAVAGNQVVSVGVPSHVPSGPLFTQPPTVGGGMAFPGGFAVSTGG